MEKKEAYKDFTKRFKLLISKHPDLIITTLSNIFTMRLIGNKTHGDLAEIAIAEFINQYMYDFRSAHVGKANFISKAKEEDITIMNELTKIEIPVSLKAYGAGPLQLSTDKNNLMFPKLEQYRTPIEGDMIKQIWEDPIFSQFEDINVLALIYDEKKMKCNILVFNSSRGSLRSPVSILSQRAGRKHPIYRFFDANGEYVCEVGSAVPPPTHSSEASGQTQNQASSISTVLLMVGLIIHTIIS